MDWTPNHDGLRSVVQLLRDSQQPSTDVQRNVRLQFEHLRENVSDFSNYLCWILGTVDSGIEAGTRESAGLVLQTNLRTTFRRLPPQVQLYIRTSLLRTLADEVRQLRGIAGNCITILLDEDGLETWPDLLPTLSNMLDTPNTSVQEGVLSCLDKICEDHTYQLMKDPSQPLNTILPKMISFFKSENKEFRKFALGTVCYFVFDMPQALLNSAEVFLTNLFALATDPYDEVRMRVCDALVSLITVKPEFLMPSINSVIEYMLHCMQDSQERVALEACKFWSSICQSEAYMSLAPFLNRLVPVLLKAMAYAEYEVAVLLAEMAEADKESDIAPSFHTSKARGGHDDDDDEDDEDDDAISEWYFNVSLIPLILIYRTLRKSAALSLDHLAMIFRVDLLPHILPPLNEMLVSADWHELESGILALGAISEGCVAGIEAHLAQLGPFLVTRLEHEHPLVRSITCWTLSRYSRWVVAQEDTQFFQLLLQGFLQRIVDTNKKVQEAACSAFASLEEESGDRLVAFLGPILENLMFAFKLYQTKNLLILYDAIGTLAESVGTGLADPRYTAVLMPPLMEKWGSTSTSDRSIIALIECMTSVAQSLGPEFLPYAEVVWVKALDMISENLFLVQITEQDPDEPEADRELMVCAMDLIAGIIDALGQQSVTFITGSTLVKLLIEILSDSNLDVRQSAYALIGDLTKAAASVLQPHIGVVLECLIASVSPTPGDREVSVCNNACWAIGELALKLPTEVTPTVPAIATKLIQLLLSTSLLISRILRENAAITLGRLAYAAPTLLAPAFEQFAAPMCLSLSGLLDNEEKDTAFRGLCRLIETRPAAIVPVFPTFCQAVVSYQSPAADLSQIFGVILVGFKNHVGPEGWLRTVEGMKSEARDVLRQRYGL